MGMTMALPFELNLEYVERIYFDAYTDKCSMDISVLLERLPISLPLIFQNLKH